MIVLPAPLKVKSLMIVCSGAVDGQGLSAGHGPGLRPADVDGRVERDAFVGLDAAGGDGQRAAAERVAGRELNVMPWAMTVPLMVTRCRRCRRRWRPFPCSPRRRRRSFQFVSRRCVHVSRAAVPGGRGHRAGVIDGAGDGADVVVNFDVAVGDEIVAVVAIALSRTPAILDDPVSAGGNRGVVAVTDQRHFVIEARGIRRAVVRSQVGHGSVQIVARPNPDFQRTRRSSGRPSSCWCRW